MDEQHQATTEDATTDPPLDSAADGSAAQTPDGDPAQSPAAEKDPNDWVTGEEPMTAPQASYLQTLCQEAGEEFDDSISKADASRRIDELQAKTGRGTD
jgi:Protein of unknown function (DUF3072)